MLYPLRLNVSDFCSDILWIKDFDVRHKPLLRRKKGWGYWEGKSSPALAATASGSERRSLQQAKGATSQAISTGASRGVVQCPGVQQYKYVLSTMSTGAWYGDITNSEYHHFVESLLGIRKQMGQTHTAINNWQVRLAFWWPFLLV